MNLVLRILFVFRLALITVTAFGGVREPSTRRFFASESSRRQPPYCCPSRKYPSPLLLVDLVRASRPRYRHIGDSDFRGPPSSSPKSAIMSAAAAAAATNQRPAPPSSSSSSALSCSLEPASSKLQDPSGNDATDDDTRALYVTIGPPCSGKTTWLQSRSGRRRLGGDDADSGNKKGSSGGDDDDYAVRDVALDDQPGIYVPVAIVDALPLLSAAAAIGTTARRDDGPLHRSVILGRSVADRLRSDDNRELGLVLLRLALRISSAEFAERMLQLPESSGPPRENATAARSDNERGSTTEVRDESSLSRSMIGAVEEVLSRHVELHGEGGDVIQSREKDGGEGLPPWMPPSVELFVQDRIFRAESAGALSGIDSAHLELRRACHSPGPVAWGNTNTRPREYKQALQLASETRRPVHFVTYCDMDLAVGAPGSIHEVNCEDDVISLACDVKDLLLRNLERLLRTGRFVPSLVIHTMHNRSQNLVKMALDQWRMQLSREAATTEPANQQVENASIARSAPSSETKRLSKFDFDRILARLANYEMNQDRTVVPLTPPQRQNRGRKPSNQAPQQNVRRPPSWGTSGSSFGYQGSATGNAPVRRPWEKMPRRERPQLEGPAPGGARIEIQRLQPGNHSPVLRPPQKVRKASWAERGDPGVSR
jgi:hypothetical protein